MCMQEGMAQLGFEVFLRRLRDQELGPAPLYARDGLLRSGFAPCLVTVLRLAAHREAPGNVGRRLAAALVRAGHLSRAVELVQSGAGGSKPGEDLLRLVAMAAEAGDLDGARALAESLTDRALHDQARVALVSAVARAGDREGAVALAETVRYPHNWPSAWIGLAEALAERGDFPAALEYAAKAAEGYGTAADMGRILLTSMEIAYACGDHAMARTFADRVEDLVRQENHYGSGQSAFLVKLLAFEVERGDLERLDTVLRSIRADAAEAAVAAATATEAAATVETAAPRSQEADGTPDILRLTISAEPAPPFDANIVTRLLETVTETAGREAALALADRGEELLRCDLGVASFQLHEAVTLLLARHGQAERALALADEIAEPDRRAACQARIVEALARSGDAARAEALARAITDGWARTRALMALVGELARRGDTARVEALVPGIPDGWARGEALIDVVAALARQGEPERAEDLAHTIPLGRTRARALAEAVNAADPVRARLLAARAVFLGGWTELVLDDIEEIAPGAALAIVDEVMAWHEAESCTHPRVSSAENS
jgi:tetratricopeptide (TPR) repeat protein